MAPGSGSNWGDNSKERPGRQIIVGVASLCPGVGVDVGVDVGVSIPYRLTFDGLGFPAEIICGSNSSKRTLKLVGINKTHFNISMINIFLI